MKSTQLLFLLFISVAAWAGGLAKSEFYRNGSKPYQSQDSRAL